MKQVWIEETAQKAVNRFCKKYKAKKQVISSQAIEIGLKELERQQQQLESNK